MQDFNPTLSRPFLEGVSPIEKQNRGGLVGSRVCAIIALNRTILSEELGRYKWYQSLISSWKCANNVVGPPKGGGLWCPISLKERNFKVYICKTVT